MKRKHIQAVPAAVLEQGSNMILLGMWAGFTAGRLAGYGKWEILTQTGFKIDLQKTESHSLTFD